MAQPANSQSPLRQLLTKDMNRQEFLGHLLAFGATAIGLAGLMRLIAGSPTQHLEGPAGPRGQAGTAGAGGSAGPAGPTGSTGLAGANGTDGSSDGGSATTDHGALTGLTDDDHPHYHNDLRGDVRYAALAHESDTTGVHGIADTSVLATDADVATAVSDHNSDTNSVHGIADTSVLATDSDVATAVSDHAADTTAVHGITDTAQLATLSDLSAHTGEATDAHDASAISFNPAGSIAAVDVQAAIEELDTEKSATNHSHSGIYEPAGTVATHEADTTNVHGIASTSALLTTADRTTTPTASKIPLADGSNKLDVGWLPVSVVSASATAPTVSSHTGGQSVVFSIAAATTADTAIYIAGLDAYTQIAFVGCHIFSNGQITVIFGNWSTTTFTSASVTCYFLLIKNLNGP